MNNKNICKLLYITIIIALFIVTYTSFSYTKTLKNTEQDPSPQNLLEIHREGLFLMTEYMLTMSLLLLMVTYHLYQMAELKAYLQTLRLLMALKPVENKKIGEKKNDAV